MTGVGMMTRISAMHLAGRLGEQEEVRQPCPLFPRTQ